MMYLMVRDAMNGESYITIPNTDESLSDAYYLGRKEANAFQDELNDIVGEERYYVTLEYAWHKYELTNIAEGIKEEEA